MKKRFYYGLFLILILTAMLTGCGPTPPASYTLTVDVFGDGTVTKTVGGVVDNGPYAAGTVVDLSAVANPAGIEVFGYWTGPLSYSSTRQITMTGDAAIEAHFGEQCGTCGGSRLEDCPQCGGSGDEWCSWCGGSGSEWEDCAVCGGSGSIMIGDELVTCSACGGSGGDDVDCHICGGSGYETCDLCGGDGQQTCSECDGTGIIESY